MDKLTHSTALATYLIYGGSWVYACPTSQDSAWWADRHTWHIQEGLSVGDVVVVEMKDGELRVRSLQAAVRQAQEMVCKYIPDPDRSLVDELIAERRAEAAREADE
jgi:hypothetical protein